MAHGLGHAPDLAIATLVDDDAQHRRAHQTDRGRCCAPVVEVDALAQPAQRAAAGLALHLGQVLLLDPERRVGQAVGQIAIVGEEQQTLGVEVEATDGEHPGLGGHQVDDYRAALESVIEAKTAGREVVRPVEPEVDDSKVLDLMDALRRSVDAAKQQRGAGGKVAEKPAGKAAAAKASPAKKAPAKKTAAKKTAKKTAAKKTASRKSA